LPEHSLTVLVEPEKVRHRADDLLNTNEEFLTAAWASASRGGAAPVDVAALGTAAEDGQAGAGGFATLAETRTTALNRFQGWWQITALGADVDLLPDASALRTGFTEPRGFHGDVEAMI